MKNLITLNYQNMIIHATNEAWFNATEIAAMFGKQPYEWLRLPETKRYLDALIKREAEKIDGESDAGKSRITKAHFVKTQKGNSDRFTQGTWLHPKLAIAFARWCDVDFAVWCDEQILELMTHNKTWQASRTESKIGFQVMQEILQAKRQADGKETKTYHYINEALLCNAALTGQRQPIQRDTLSNQDLKMLTKLESNNAVWIAQDMPYQERKTRLFEMAAPIRALIASKHLLLNRSQGA